MWSGGKGGPKRSSITLKKSRLWFFGGTRRFIPLDNVQPSITILKALTNQTYEYLSGKLPSFVQEEFCNSVDWISQLYF